MSDAAAKDILKALQKRLPKHGFHVPSIDDGPFVSSGSLLLDLALRDGREPSGMLGGKVYEVYGERHSGKTAIAMRWAREYQKAGGLVVWLDAENAYSMDLGIKIGLDHSEEKFLYTEPYALEHILMAIEEIAEKMHDREIPILIVVDSIAAKNPSAYMMDDSKATDSLPAAAPAKMLHGWFRRGALWYASGSKISVIFINHLTANPRPYGGDVTPHGSALAYYSWVRLKVSGTDFKDKDASELGGGVSHAIGSWIKCKVTKNKMGGRHSEAEFPFYYSSGFNIAVENIAYLVSRGDLEKVANRDGGGTGRIRFGDATYFVWQFRDLYLKEKSVRDTVDQMVRDRFRSELEARRALR